MNSGKCLENSFKSLWLKTASLWQVSLWRLHRVLSCCIKITITTWTTPLSEIRNVNHLLNSFHYIKQFTFAYNLRSNNPKLNRSYKTKQCALKGHLGDLRKTLIKAISWVKSHLKKKCFCTAEPPRSEERGRFSNCTGMRRNRPRAYENTPLQSIEP